MASCKAWLRKFSHAFRGLVVGMHGQSSFLVHLLVALAAVALGLVVGLTSVEWAILTVTIGLVLAMELLNSGLEALARAVTDQENPWIKDALDIAAGAVLLASLVAVLVGICLFLPHLVRLSRLL
ncbi:MAG: diacylglycerol kinase [Pirellulaceae bacterium]|nr:MAG: diacylglycerol kinase [Pirellulaceae bacterium]GIW93375.1 MAG: diacylglycerol kinase [Pirellulaceae bacterium]